VAELSEGDRRLRVLVAAIVVWGLLAACGQEVVSATATAYPTVDPNFVRIPDGEIFPTQQALQTPEVFAARMEMLPRELIRATVKVEMLDDEGGVLSFCSGGLIEGGTLLSARHCFWDPQEGGVPGIPVPYDKLRISQPHLPDGITIEVDRADVQIYDSFVGDMWAAKGSVFDVPGAMPRDRVEYGWMPPLGEDNAVPVYSLGFPATLSLLNNVAVMPVIGRAYNLYDWPEGIPPQFETIEAAASGGNSGGLWVIVKGGVTIIVSTVTHGVGRNDPIPAELRSIVEN